MTKHILYTDEDANRPDVICDSNHSVVLALCKVCGLGEAELDDVPECPGSFMEGRKQAEAKRMQRMTNEEFLKDIMNFNPYGGVCQAVIVEGLRSYCEHVTEGEIDWSENAFISKEAWVGAAKHILNQIELKYGKRKA